MERPRTHFTKEPVLRFDGSRISLLGGKPGGLWYGFGFDWLEFSTKEEICLGYRYVQELELNMERILVVPPDELKEFAKKYSLWLASGFALPWIAWKGIAAEYDGVEFSPYQKSAAYHAGQDFWLLSSLSFYWGLDVASGCIWGEGAIKSIGEARPLGKVGGDVEGNINS